MPPRHDVGLGILNWMAQTPTVLLKAHFMDVKAAAQKHHATAIEIHAVRRYTGDKVIGGLKGPSGGDGEFTSHLAIHERFAERDAKDPDDAARVGAAAARFRPVNLTGYASAGKRKMLPDAWETYAASDCPHFDRNLSAATCFTADTQATWRGRRRLRDDYAVADDAIWLRAA